MRRFSLIFSTIFFLITLSACDSGEAKWMITEKQATKDAENLSNDVTQAYLQSYPLDQQTKKECVQSLNNQYITKTEHKADLYYARAFQYRAEKLGFLKFLKDHNLPCSGIDYGPKFIATENAYQINCTCGNSYSMQFDYDKKEWHLK